MGILIRLFNLFRSNANDILNKAEDPEKMLIQMISDLETQKRKVSMLRNKLDLAGIPHLINPSHIVPVMIKDPVKCRQISDILLNENGIEPQPEELASRLGMPLEKVRKVLKIAKEPISLETPVGDEDDSHLGDFIEDKAIKLPLDAAIQNNLREATTSVLSTLTPREERVLRMRFGIGMNTDHTLEEVGQQFSVTRERIRQIEAKGLRKLKHPSRSRKLRSFLDN